MAELKRRKVSRDAPPKRPETEQVSSSESEDESETVDAQAEGEEEVQAKTFKELVRHGLFFSVKLPVMY